MHSSLANAPSYNSAKKNGRLKLAWIYPLYLRWDLGVARERLALSPREQVAQRFLVVTFGKLPAQARFWCVASIPTNEPSSVFDTEGGMDGGG